MTPQDHGYRAFITELHRRMAEAGSKAALIGGIGPKIYAAALVLLTLLGRRDGGASGARARDRRMSSARCFWSASPLLFAWQIGGFVRRNRPRSLYFRSICRKRLLP